MDFPSASVLGRRLKLSPVDDRMALALAQQCNLPEVVARLLATRGVTMETVSAFLNPTLRDQMPDPERLLDMKKAVGRLAAAITSGEPITIFGDYDVDGATSTALLTRFFRSVGANVTPYIPDRMQEGYGPTREAFDKFAAAGCKLVITVDCGIVAHDAIRHASDMGLQIIVVDHHVAEANLPPAYAVVNPNRLDENSTLGNLAAVGVAFLVIVAVNKHLREAGWYGNGRLEPDIRTWLDLVALGTICDVVPLTGLNRVYVTQGLRIMARRTNVGLSALADMAGVTEPPGTYHAGFIFGPRINAAGRIGKGVLGAELLMTDDPITARQIAAQLCQLNDDRKELERLAFEEACGMLAARGEIPQPVLMMMGNNWHQGVIGIVASRLKEKLNKPVIICTPDGKGGFKGSGRSVVGIDLGAAVLATKQAGFLTSGGGHPMAAGMTGLLPQFADAEAFLQERVARQLHESPLELSAIKIDAILSLRGANLEFAKWMDQVGPFGAGNPEPTLMLTDVLIQRPEVFGAGHVKCYLGSTIGGSLRAAAFRSADEALGRFLLNPPAAPVSVIGRIRINRWQGREQVEFNIEDAATA